MSTGDTFENATLIFINSTSRNDEGPMQQEPNQSNQIADDSLTLLLDKAKLTPHKGTPCKRTSVIVRTPVQSPAMQTIRETVASPAMSSPSPTKKR